jgi:hypothetical protein
MKALRVVVFSLFCFLSGRLPVGAISGPDIVITLAPLSQSVSSGRDVSFTAIGDGVQCTVLEGYRSPFQALTNPATTYAGPFPVALSGGHDAASSQFHLTMKLSLSSGLLAGSFFNPQTSRSSAIKGGVLQKQQAAAGWFLGSKRGGGNARRAFRLWVIG